MSKTSSVYNGLPFYMWFVSDFFLTFSGIRFFTIDINLYCNSANCCFVSDYFITFFSISKPHDQSVYNFLFIISMHPFDGKQKSTNFKFLLKTTNFYYFQTFILYFIHKIINKVNWLIVK